MRVIAGRLGGRRLVAPSGTSTRPTSDRVREALFSILADVTGARVLDLYAGTGALGIEALSRGAAHAVFVEAAPRTTAVLKKNLDALGLGGESRVLSQRVDRAIESVTGAGPYDLVLVDPPYSDVVVAAGLVGDLGAKGAFAEDARIVIEHASGAPPPAVAGIEVVSERRYGDTGVTLAAWVGSA